MKIKHLMVACGVLTLISSGPLRSAPRAPAPEETSRRITDEILNRGQALSNLKSLLEGGHRLCGSEGAAQAVKWAKAKLESYGLDRVWLQPVKVPVWTRGSRETASAISATATVPLKIAALGRSGATPPGGIEAPVVEVHSLDEARKLGASLKGKIVFYNRPMDPTVADAFKAYADAVDQRSSGPGLASRYGAVGALVRTMTTLADDPHPHTGGTSFRSGAKPIPAAAVSTRDANALSALIAAGSTRVRLDLSASSRPDAVSYNVIGEIAGSELPGEIVVVGGHLDSWDLSAGAHDDGAGVVQSIEALRAYKALGLRPKRTVRAVLFMCEELGGIGGDEYARQAKLKGEKHLAATESDRGGFKPQGFAVEDPSGRALPRLKEWSRLLAPVHADLVTDDESGTDVEPLIGLGTATLGLLVESKHYFDVHHSEIDRLEAVDPSELNQGAAAMAILTYLMADLGL